jgi:glycosyltransferase involved in cell wall biosynthesis
MAMPDNKNNKRRKVAIAHPGIGWGGSERRVFWGIQSLRDDYDLTLITTNDIDCGTINSYYGTSLSDSDFRVEKIPLPFFLKKSNKAAALRGAFYHSYCKKVVRDYDVFINAYGPFDLGVPSIQVVADFSWDEEIRRKLHPSPAGIVHRKSIARKLYLFIVNRLFYFHGKKYFSGKDKIIVVSRWVAKQIEEKYNIRCEVINSPVPGTFHHIPSREKEYGFVCLGRISREKRIEEIVEILSAIRRKGYNIHLHVIGSGGDMQYSEYVDSLAHDNRDWIFMEGRRFGAEKINILAHHLFGIHACIGDAFPGAVVEMIKAGCIPFVHKEGGSAEIVNNDLLIYGSLKEAVAKVEYVLNNEQIQKRLSEEMAEKGNMYSLEAFVRQFRDSVADFLEKERGKKVALSAS